MKKLLIVVLTLFVGALGLKAQNITFRLGETSLLYDSRYYDALFLNKRNTFPSFNLRIGMEDHSKYSSASRRPEYGVAFEFEGTGDVVPALGGKSMGIGNLYGVYGYYDRPFFTIGNLSFGYMSGFGAGFCFSKRASDDLNLPKEMVSLPLSFFINGGLNLKYNIHNRYELGVVLYFNHVSNGAVNYPNKGCNAYGFGLSVSKIDARYTAARVAEKLTGMRRKPTSAFRPHFQYDIQVSGGVTSVEEYYKYYLKEYGLIDNKYSSKFTIEADCLYKYARGFASGVGVDVFFTPFVDEISKYKTGKKPFQPVSLGLSFQHEFSFRSLAVAVGVGRYLYHNDGLSRTRNCYQLVNIRYHMPKLYNTYVGFNLKAHGFMFAESVLFAVGKTF